MYPTSPKRIALRYLLAKEFPTDEALNSYLEEHPNADPKNHTVTKKKSPPKKKKKEPLVNSSEASLPSKASQKVKDPDELFDEAKKAHQKSVEWLNQGKGLDSVIDASVVRVDKGEGEPDYSKPGPIIVIGPPKSKARSKEKVESDFDGDWSQLLDVVRASVAVDTMDDLQHVMGLLRKSGMRLARKPKDRFSNPTDAGYRDLLLNVEYPNGHIGELQLHLKPILQAKKKGHADYETVRSIGANAKKEGREDLTEKEQDQIDKAMRHMRQLYDDAWEAATGGAMGKKAATKPKIQYYLYHDQPVIWSNGKFPMYNGKKPIYELDKFIEQAEPITDSEYKKLSH